MPNQGVKRDKRAAFRTTDDVKKRLEKISQSGLYEDRKPSWIAEHYVIKGLTRDERRLAKMKGKK